MERDHCRTGRRVVCSIVAGEPDARSTACTATARRLDNLVAQTLGWSHERLRDWRDGCVAGPDGAALHITPALRTRPLVDGRCLVVGVLTVLLLDPSAVEIGELAHPQALPEVGAGLATAVVDDRVFLWNGWAWERVA